MEEKPEYQKGTPANNDGSEENANTAIEQYQRIQVNTHHFNDIQAGIRKLASVWLLAAFGAIAYMVRGETMAIAMIDTKILISAVGLMGAIGLLVLLILDLVVYQRLIDAVFLLALRLEYQYRSLPPIRTLMMLYSRKKGMTRYMRLYYLVPISAFVVISLLSSIWYRYEAGTSAISAFIPLIITAVTITIPVVGVVMTGGKIKEYKEMARGFGDESFDDYLERKDYESVLKSH